jgi:hypothetical protein
VSVAKSIISSGRSRAAIASVSASTMRPSASLCATWIGHAVSQALTTSCGRNARAPISFSVIASQQVDVVRRAQLAERAASCRLQRRCPACPYACRTCSCESSD